MQLKTVRRFNSKSRSNFPPAVSTGKTLPPIYFYLPASYYSVSSNSLKHDWSTLNNGVCVWTVQTCHNLQAIGVPCHLTNTFPDEGIVLAHRDALEGCDLQSKSGAMLICIKAEREGHPAAQLHVVQNSRDRNFRNSYFMPHWTQPQLVARDRARGDRFETIAYFGRPENLAPELQDSAWQQKLQEMGLQWRICENREEWTDYSQIDATISVRSFDRRQLSQTNCFFCKPATKLYNSWLAGTPAILGCESAFQGERRSELDYLEVSSVQSAIAAIKHLRDNPSLRQAMQENARSRAAEILPQQITLRWHDFLQQVAIPTYQRWQQTPLKLRQLQGFGGTLDVKRYRFKQKARSFISSIF
ncbi:glycosyltransferase [Lusitaniella coriacea]|uniref:glycosyltransferase n=1 Tax=Lusitaniella coriacea TaxID=1983105 RepID=UPI003CF623EF